MNRLVWHEFTSSPASTGLPGQEYFAGTHLNPKVTWWNAGSAFFDYLNRVQFLMQQGSAVADVLYFYGDNIPNFVRLKADDPAHVLPGYDYDVVNEDALLHTIRASDGNLQGPDGMRWKAITLPATGRVSLAVLQKLEAYVRGGGVVVGTKPEATTGLVSTKAKATFAALTQKLWSDCSAGSHHAYGRGQVFCTADTRSALMALAVVPDAIVERGAGQKAMSAADFDYIHRRVGDTEIYFVRNGSDHAWSQNVLFRAGSKVPELWDPVRGVSIGVPDYSLLSSGQVRVAMHLAPFGSAFVIFARRSLTTTRALSESMSHSEPVVPMRSWSLAFQPDRGAPDQAIDIKDFRSWTESPVAGMRYFSGSAVYSAEAAGPVIEKGDSVWLCFESVREIARVRINGRDAGTVWAYPFQLRVDSLLHAGSNKIEVEVTNLWPNRIIGDLQPDAKEHITQSNITAYRANGTLLPSGLIGPVSWSVVHPQE